MASTTAPATSVGPTHNDEIFEVGPSPATRREYMRSLVEHIPVIRSMTRKDFHTRYKRANLGVLWAIALPLLQATVLITIFSRVLELRTGGRVQFGSHVLGGIIPYSYFTASVGAAATAVVDGSSLAEKIWFPRSMLVIVPSLANLVTHGIGVVVLIIATPIVHGEYSRWTLLFLVAPPLLVGFVISLGLCLSALHVYFRDVRFMVQAVLMVSLYVTPIIYPKDRAGRFGGWLDFNPLTGIVSLYQSAIAGAAPELRPVVVSIVVTAVLLVIGLEAHRRHDRLFVDLL